MPQTSLAGGKNSLFAFNLKEEQNNASYSIVVDPVFPRGRQPPKMGREPIILAIFPRKPQEIKRESISVGCLPPTSQPYAIVSQVHVSREEAGEEGEYPTIQTIQMQLLPQCTHVFLIKSSSTMVNLANVELSLYDYELSLENLNPSLTDDEVCKQWD